MSAPCVVVFAALAMVGADDKLPVAPEVDVDAMVAFEAGEFPMGWPAQECGPYGDVWFVDQQPERLVSLGAFRIDAFEVTVSEFARFLTYAGGEKHFHRDQPIERVRDGYLPAAGTASQPMRQVTWSAARDYCLWAGERLPTEAEWARAARSLGGYKFPWGDDGPNCTRAVYFTGSAPCENGPVTVGSRAAGASPEGVFDLAGSVAEWTADWYAPYDPAALVNPRGPADGDYKVVRGGSYLDAALWIRAHARYGAPPDGRSDGVGFRCAWSEPEAEPVLRGELRDPPDDIERELGPRPYAPALSRPMVLAEGLSTPMGIVNLAGRYYVVEAGAGQVVAVDQASLTVEAVMVDLDLPGGIATDGLEIFVSEGGTGKVWRAAPDGGPEELATADGEPGPIVADVQGVVWATQSRLWAASTAGGSPAESLASGLDGVGGLVLVADHVYFAQTGANEPKAAGIGRVSRSGGAVEILVGEQSLGSDLRPTDVALHADGRVYFSIVLRGWPTSGLLCSIPTGAGNMVCHSESPPGLDRIATGGSWVYWTNHRSVSRFDPASSATFENPAIWTRSAGLLVDGDAVVWTDRQTGRVHRSGI